MATTTNTVAAQFDMAIEAREDNLLTTVHVLDGHHQGTLFTWLDGEWAVADVENKAFLGLYSRLAVVSLFADADPDCGLNQAQLGCDLDEGYWVIDADDLTGLESKYGEDLEIIWEQAV